VVSHRRGSRHYVEDRMTAGCLLRIWCKYTFMQFWKLTFERKSKPINTSLMPLDALGPDGEKMAGERKDYFEGKNVR